MTEDVLVHTIPQSAGKTRPPSSLDEESGLVFLASLLFFLVPRKSSPHPTNAVGGDVSIEQTRKLRSGTEH